MDENCAKRLELAPAGVSAGPCESASPSSVAILRRVDKLDALQTLRSAIVPTSSMNTRTSICSILLAAAVSSAHAQPVITKQPTNQTASLFADATFRVTVTGVAPLSYQWRFNDGDLIGKTSTAMTVTNVQRLNTGNYSVIVTNLSGSVTSQVATLTITPFNSMYFFGFSWTDTRGILPDGSKCFTWSDPQKYYQGHACNGPMWPEFLSTNLGLAYVASNNYAYCGASASDILTQVISFPAPSKPQLSLYCLWTEGPDVDFPGLVNALTNEVAGNQLLQTTISNNSNSVNRLYTKGARAIVIEVSGYLKYGGITSLFGTNSALLSMYSQYSARLNAGLIDAMNRYSQTRPDLRILSIDLTPKFNDVIDNPAQYGLTVTTISALADTNLTDMSFTGPGADYVRWDPFHATSKLHKLITVWHLDALTNSILETLEARIVGGSPNIQMNHLQIGRDYTLQKSVDLRNWQEAISFTASAGTNQWTAPSVDATATFYRLKWQP